MVASLIKFSDAVILRLQAETGSAHLTVTADQWQPLSIFPESANVNLERLANRSWVASESASEDDLGELFALAKSLLANSDTAENGDESVRLRQQEGQCYFKLSKDVAKRIADHPSRCVLLGACLKPAEDCVVSDEELTAALERVNSKYSQAMTWLAQ